MNRKNTILIVVSLNAALLFLLFLVAHTSAPVEGGTNELGSLPQQSFEAPSFVPIDSPAAVGEPTAPSVIELPPSPLGAAPDVVHQLPPLVAAELPLPAAPAPAAAPVAAAPLPKHETSAREVTVKKGDTLDKIARAHRTTVDEIIKLNHLPSSFLRVGQTLKLPSEKNISVAKAPKAVETETQGAPEYYTVRVGDNPWTVAMKHHMKVEDLLRLNNLNEEKARKLKVGDRLRVK